MGKRESPGLAVRIFPKPFILFENNFKQNKTEKDFEYENSKVFYFV
jgi:hypothetical protein